MNVECKTCHKVFKGCDNNKFAYLTDIPHSSGNEWCHARCGLLEYLKTTFMLFLEAKSYELLWHDFFIVL